MFEVEASIPIRAPTSTASILTPKRMNVAFQRPFAAWSAFHGLPTPFLLEFSIPSVVISHMTRQAGGEGAKCSRWLLRPPRNRRVTIDR